MVVVTTLSSTSPPQVQCAPVEPFISQSRSFLDWFCNAQTEKGRELRVARKGGNGNEKRAQFDQASLIIKVK